MTNQVYTDEELIEHAKRYVMRRAWKSAGVEERKAGGYSHYGAALHRGHALMQQCCAHMPDERGGFRGCKYTDDQLTKIAKPFKHRSEFKRDAKGPYDAAWRRGILDKICAHMSPMASPYGKDYEIYVYEFKDSFAYVGLTFLPQARDSAHKARSKRAVAAHMKECPIYERKVLECGLTREQVAEAEKRWIRHYQEAGWTMLNKSKGGSTGSVRGSKWTKEAVMAEARKYQTRQEWIDNSQMSYRIAKREGWYEEASAHMPKRVLGIGAGVPKSAAAKKKMRQAKFGKSQSAAAKAARSEAIRKWWAIRKSALLAPAC